MKKTTKILLVLFPFLFPLMISSGIVFATQAPNLNEFSTTGRQAGDAINGNLFFMWLVLTFLAVIVAGVVVRRINLLNVTVERQSRQISDYKTDLQAKKEQLVGQAAKIQKVLKTDKLLKHISHEFKTPLTVLLGYLGDIEEALDSRPKEVDGRDTGEMVSRQIKYIDRLVHQLMDLSKVEGAVDCERKLLNVSSELSTIIPMYDGYAKKLEVEVRSSIKNDLIINAEKESFERVISNLICNAIKYNRKHGTVEVIVTEENQHAKIVVRDSGIGISGEDKEIIFKQFGVVENRETLDHQVISTGLGLAIVKEGVEANQGSIEVQSKLGLGSEFIVRFPLSEMHAEKHITSENKVRNSFDVSEIKLDSDPFKKQEVECDSNITKLKVVNDARKTILVLEDIDDIAYLLEDVLSKEFNVVRARNGVEGMEQARGILPDVIISDVMMPVMDGFEFAKAIKQNESTQHIPLLFLTGISSEEAQLKGLELGAVDFIQKPFNTAVIQLKIKNCLEQNHRPAEKSVKTSVANRDVRRKVSRDPNFTQKLDAYIEKHLAEKFTVEEMASKLAMNRSAFTRKVKDITSLNTQQYILRYRLIKAYDLLLTSQSVAEVAYNLGFSTQNHMSTAFTKQFGITCRERMSGKEATRQPFVELTRS